MQIPGHNRKQPSGLICGQSSMLRPALALSNKCPQLRACSPHAEHHAAAMPYQSRSSRSARSCRASNSTKQRSSDLTPCSGSSYKGGCEEHGEAVQWSMPSSTKQRSSDLTPCNGSSGSGSREKGIKHVNVMHIARPAPQSSARAT